MKCLIIGGGGFVGSWLTHELITRGHEVMVVDPFIYYSQWDAKRVSLIKQFKKDFLHTGAKIFPRKFEDGGNVIISENKPEIVIHLAGIPLEKMDDFDISLKQLTDDIGLTYKIIKVVKENAVKKFVYMSSIAVYGDCEEEVTEDCPLLPKTPYGIMKASGEFLTKSEISNWNIVRTTNIYGFGDLNERASNTIINKILTGEKFWVNNSIAMDFIYVKDLVAGIANVALGAQNQEVFHISGGEATGLVQYVEMLKKYFSFDYEIKELNDRPRRGTMNNKKAKKILGWYPHMTTEKGIADYIKYVKKYKIA